MPLVTTVAGAQATAGALKAMAAGELESMTLQEYFGEERAKVKDFV